MSQTYIHHLVLAAEYDALPASEPYVPSGFDRDGFIHCTQSAELLRLVANAVFAQVPGEFLVLVIDPARLTSLLRYEPPVPPAPPGSPLRGELFPHIYGPLNRDAIVAVREARRAPNGTCLQTSSPNPAATKNAARARCGAPARRSSQPFQAYRQTSTGCFAPRSTASTWLPTITSIIGAEP